MEIQEVKDTTLSKNGEILIPFEMIKNTSLYKKDKIQIISFKDRIEIKSKSKNSQIINQDYLEQSWLSDEEDEAWKDL